MTKGTVTFHPLEFPAILVLRGDAENAVLRRVIRNLMGVKLPASTGLAKSGDKWRLLCLGPDRWLALSQGTSSIATGMERALKGEHVAILDVTDAWLAARLEGPGAGEILARGCAIDLHPHSLGEDTVIQTLYRRANVIVLPFNHALTFDLFVERSAAPYVWDHIRQDMRTAG